MKAIYFYTFLAILCGAILPVQAVLNAKMGEAVKDPIYATLISFVVGSLGLLLYVLVIGVDMSRISQAKTESWTIWTPGLMGAFYVGAVIILVPRIGAALTFGLVVTGQLALSLLVDHYGWLGMSVHPVNSYRILGIALIIVGVILIRNY